MSGTGLPPIGVRYRVSKILCHSFEIDDRLDDSVFGPRERWKVRDHLSIRGSMRDPGGGTDLATADQIDNASKIAGQRVATGFDGHLWLVHRHMR